MWHRFRRSVGRFGFAAVVMGCFCGRLCAADFVSQQQILSLVAEELKTLERTKGLIITARSDFSFDPTYQTMNPKMGSADETSNVEDYTVKMYNGFFRIGVDFHSKAGKDRLGYLKVYDGTHTMFHYAGQDQLLFMNNGAGLDPDNSAPLGTILFVPYGFMFGSTTSPRIPILTKGNLVDGQALKQFGERSVFEKAGEKSKLRVSRVDGSYFDVEFDAEMGGLPKKYELHGANGDPYVIYETVAADKIALGDRAFPYAKKFRYTRFDHGNRISERLVSIGEVKLVDTIDEEEFTIDPASADNIFDADTKRMIRVPK